jgi:aspartate/methionine/tyrosine aminotransferase
MVAGKMSPSNSPRIASASPELSSKTAQFTESVIREMTRLAIQYKAVNLSQGFPDFPAPIEIKRAAQEAIAADINQYAITWGSKSLRNAIAEKFARTQGVEADPEREITVCCGSTEAMMSAMMAIVNPGDEVVVFEPFYENYGPDAILSGAQPRFVKLREPDWSFDPQELAAAFGPRTKAIILNTPNNPT